MKIKRLITNEPLQNTIINVLDELGIEILTWYCGWLSHHVVEVNTDKHDDIIRTDELQRFEEWCKINGYWNVKWHLIFERYESEVHNENR